MNLSISRASINCYPRFLLPSSFSSIVSKMEGTLLFYSEDLIKDGVKSAFYTNNVFNYRRNLTWIFINFHSSRFGEVVSFLFSNGISEKCFPPGLPSFAWTLTFLLVEEFAEKEIHRGLTGDYKKWKEEIRSNEHIQQIAPSRKSFLLLQLPLLICERDKSS